MRLKSTIILLIVAFCIGSFIWFYERNQLSTEEREREGKRAFRVKADDIDRVEIINGEKTIVCAKDKNGIWQMEQPLKYKADKSQISGICKRFESLKSERVLRGNEIDEEKLEEFGLKEPRITARFRAGGEDKELNLGKDTPLGNDIYAQAGNKGDVYIINKSIHDLLKKEVKDLRDRGVIEFDVGEIEKVELKRGDGVIELVRDNDAWRITEPVKGRGDPDKISGILRKLKNLRVRDFIIDAPESLSEYGLEEPSSEVVLWNKKDKSFMSVLFGSESGKNKAYAKRRWLDAVYTVDNAVLKDLRLKPEEFRDRKVTRLAQGSIENVAISKGDRKLILAKKDKKWEIREPGEYDADDSEVQGLLRKLTALKAEDFVADNKEDLRRYGLEKGAMEIMLTPVDGAEEKILIGKRFSRGKKVYLTKEGIDEILAVNAGILKDVSVDPLRYKKKQVFDARSGDKNNISTIPSHVVDNLSKDLGIKQKATSASD